MSHDDIDPTDLLDAAVPPDATARQPGRPVMPVPPPPTCMRIDVVHDPDLELLWVDQA